MTKPDGQSVDFGYIRECARYIIDSKISRSKNVDVVAANISSATRNGLPLYGITFQVM